MYINKAAFFEGVGDDGYKRGPLGCVLVVAEEGVEDVFVGVEGVGFGEDAGVVGGGEEVEM